MMDIHAPFPWFGGKRRVASHVWKYFGNPANYVEPFAGSLAVLLGRNEHGKAETVNDIDCYLANFWRAAQSDPYGVANHADWPVNEADLHARHRWLVNRDDFRERMKTDPDYCDVKIAGWWVWGISQWIGGGWCRIPKDGCKVERRRPNTKSSGVTARKRPNLARGGKGVCRRQIPNLHGNSGATGRGVVASGKRGEIYDWMDILSDRLRHVRVCCGDWLRVLGPSPTTCIGTTAVFLDPPYGNGSDRDPDIYASDSMDISEKVAQWAIDHGDDPKFRIALCGYEGEHKMPQSWKVVSWASSGYGNRTEKGTRNRKRERIWFSPYCCSLEGEQMNLFKSSAD